ncbi:MAG: MATE family efflux transporter [Paludibacteraceae bacterium]|nr:MATE family efflux transporter [Paludibacteraceae bacterium]
MNTNELFKRLRGGQQMTTSQQIELAVWLALPSIIAQLSSIIMQYIDASMVGHLGANASGSIGLVATTTWLFGGMCHSAVTGFSVQVAHRIGAKDAAGARSVLRQGIVSILIIACGLSFIGLCIHRHLPIWLGGNKDIVEDASAYLCIYMLNLPFMGMYHLASAMLRCSGNTRVPGILGSMMCLLDVVFNLLLIFPERTLHLGEMELYMPGAGLGVKGAALGTMAATLTIAMLTWYFLAFRSAELNIFHHHGSYRLKRDCIRKAIKIGGPISLEHAVMCGAQVVCTAIVAPLGVVAIAANAFAVTAESICYMPGYGIADAATTLTGQTIGAGRKELCRHFAFITIGMGMAVMSIMGILMYLCAPYMMSLLTPVGEICELGTSVLRIEAFAEPMFAASIVAYAVFIGSGDTVVPCTMNFASIWLVRITLTYFLAPIWGLQGVWIAMAIELCFRGSIFLIHYKRGKWLR